MHKLTFSLLWMFVLSLPLEQLVTLGPAGSISRLFGLVAVVSGVLTVVGSGRFRSPGVVVRLSFLFSLTAMLSMVWTISVPDTTRQVATYAQLLGLVWLVWEFARSRRQQFSLVFAFLVAAYISFGAQLLSYGGGAADATNRYSALRLDLNEFGIRLAIGIPLAWHLLLNSGGAVRLLAAAYVPIAMFSIMLTASRAAFLAAIVSLAIVPLTLPARSLRKVAVIALVLMTAGLSIAVWVPQASWTRFLTIEDELRGGTFSGRTGIWRAGAEAFLQRPLLGAGAGAFAKAVEPMIGAGNAAHNAFLAVAVEQGMLGAIAFGLLLGACAINISRIASAERRVWIVAAAAWLVGAMSLGLHSGKVTWLLIALIGTQAVPVVAAVSRNRAPLVVSPLAGARPIRSAVKHPGPTAVA